jgi:hypothetical protein
MVLIAIVLYANVQDPTCLKRKAEHVDEFLSEHSKIQLQPTSHS